MSGLLPVFLKFFRLALSTLLMNSSVACSGEVIGTKYIFLRDEERSVFHCVHLLSSSFHVRMFPDLRAGDALMVNTTGRWLLPVCGPS